MEIDFLKVLSDSGIPTTQAELETRWKDEVMNVGSAISNDDKMSPFWRFTTAVITAPALWLINFVAVTLFPNAYVKLATGDFLELLADAVNLTRKPATKAVGVVTFTRQDGNVSVTIPSGTLINTTPINGVVFSVITTESKVFNGTDMTVDVAVQATLEGAAHNLAAGYFAVLASPIAGIVSTANPIDWLSTPGADIENDTNLRARVRNQFGTASDFHTDSVYKSIIGTFPGVNIDAIWFEHDAPRGPGTANAFVLFDFAANVAQYLTDINLYITDQGHHGHGDDLQVFQMPEQNQTLGVTVWHVDFLTAQQLSDLQANITDFVNAAFRENQSYTPTLTYPYARFSFSKLGQELHRQFEEVHSVDFSLPDIVTALWIPRLTSLTVTLNVTE